MTLPTDCEQDGCAREMDAAGHFGRSIRTIGRWLNTAGIAGWDGFLRFWTLAVRDSNSPNGRSLTG